MVRASRDFGTMKEEIRRLILETNSQASGWDEGLVIDVFNRKKDYREMQLQDTGEGFNITVHDTDIIQDQEEYSIPTEAGRFRRVLRFIEPRDLFVPLEREEKNIDYTYLGGIYIDETYIPTYRMIDNHIILTPPPTLAITNGLRIEMESSTDRFTSDSDTLPDSWPLFAETLLIYDTALELFNIEFAQGAPPEGIVTSIAEDRARYEGMWLQYVDKRSFGPIYSEPLRIENLS